VTRAELRSQINQTFAGDPDVALFYFAGHGLIEPAGGYIVTQDAIQNDPGITMDEILKIANTATSKDRIVILDCCHSGTFGVPSHSVAQLGLGLTVLTACREYEEAKEKKGRGIFSSLVVSALQGGAADLRGHITPGSVYAYVDQALGPWGQRPMFRTNVTKFTSLRTIEPPVPLEVIRQLTDIFPSPEERFALDPSFEDTHESADQEKVLIFKSLQKLVSVGLVRPYDEDHMYYAAINSKSCHLTALGLHYWRLVDEKVI
jgi:hypothetical protein